MHLQSNGFSVKMTILAQKDPLFLSTAFCSMSSKPGNKHGCVLHLTLV